MSRRTRGYLIGFVGITIWSTTGILIGYLINHYGMPPLLLAFWRNLLVCVALLPSLFIVRRSQLRIDRTLIRFYVFFGFILAVFNSIWTVSVQTNGAAVATVLGYSSAGFTAVFAWWIFKEQLRLPKITAVTLSLLGCVLVSNAYDPQMWHLNPLGVITGLLSGVLFAAYNLLGKEAARRHISPWTTLLYSFAFSALFTLLFNLLALIVNAQPLNAILPSLPADGWFTLIILSFFPTVLGFGLYNMSMNYLPASVASLLATSEPAMTALEAYIFLNERMTLVQMVGSLVILSAVIIVSFEREKEPVLQPNRS